MGTPLGFATVSAVSFIYTEATHLLSKLFPEPKLRKMVGVTLLDVGQTLWILYNTVKHMAQYTWGAILPYGDSSC